MIRIILADDHPMVRHGLRAVVATADDMTVVEEVDNGVDAVQRATALAPDVVLMDLQMPGLHGIEATRQIVLDRAATAVLVLTMFDDDETIFAAVRAGAIGYLVKGADGADILAAIRAAASGQPVFGAALAARLRRWFAAPPPRDAPFPQLTARELEILDHLAAGLSNSDIARTLHLSSKTVANNVSAILNKLQLPQRTQAIVRAREAGLGRSAPNGRDDAAL
jgi:DNA-binding NarL/FixJ family response regulator